jgi:hypothetical protein
VNGNKAAENTGPVCLAEHCQSGSCAFVSFHENCVLFLKEDFADNGYRRIYNENDYD